MKICEYVTETVKQGALEIQMRGCDLGKEKGHVYAGLHCQHNCYYGWGQEPKLHLCTSKQVIKGGL